MVSSVAAVANPARLLADLLTSWQNVPPNKTPEAFRNDPGWVVHRRATRHLLAIEQFVDAMAASGQPADEYRECLPSWTAAVFSFGAGWQGQTNATRAVIGNGDLRMLRSLATLMTTAHYVEPITAPGVQSLVASLDQAETLIRASEAIGDDARRYLLGLMVEASTTVKDIETFGEAEARRSVFELGGAMTAVAGRLRDEPEGPTWAARAGDLLEKLVLLGAGLGIAYAESRLGITPGTS